MSNKHLGNREDQFNPVDSGVPVRAPVRYQRGEWAENWFAGSASCPMCGSDDLQIVDVNTDDSTRIEEWKCASKDCATRWQVELRESAVGLYRDADGMDSDWYERPPEAATSHIEATDRRETATILAALGFWRREGLMSAGHEQDIATDHGRIHSLSAVEIDELCERIRRGEFRSPSR